MNYFVYILKSGKDNGYYIGYTANLNDRINRHTRGRSKATRTRLPLELVYKEEFTDKAEAIKREKYLKKLKSRKYIEKLITGP